MYNQVDPDGYSRSHLDRIIDYRKDDTAVEREKMHITTKSGQKCIRMTTHGWELLCQLIDDSTEWITLKKLKESHPLEVVDFATAQGIAQEPELIGGSLTPFVNVMA